MNSGQKGWMFSGAAIAVLAVVGLAAAVSYSFPSSGVLTNTNTTTVTGGQLSDCGFQTTCSAYDPSGLVLSLSINTTSVRTNGSFSYSLSLVNPTSQIVNISKSSQWYMSGLLSPWLCATSPGPYGFAVFRGYYTLQNVTTATNVLRQALMLGCIYTGINRINVTSYSLSPHSTFALQNEAGYFDGSPIYAINGTCIPVSNYSSPGTANLAPNACAFVSSLGSDKPAIYTMVVGDEWGGFALLHFSVLVGSG